MSFWPDSLVALRHRNFRLYFAGHAVSTLGTWLQQVALAWLVYRVTGSAALLGLTSCVALLPQLLIGPLAGAWIDRHDKRRLLMWVESLLGLQALLLALCTAQGWVSAPLLVLLAVLFGVLNAVDTPLRQSLIGAFIDEQGERRDLANALALNATLFTSSRFIGPPLAGLLLGLTSEAFCFALNALSYLGLVTALALMRLPATPRAAGSFGNLLSEGLSYALHTPAVRQLVLGVLVLNFTACSYVVLLPVFARDVFGGDARTLGLLWGAAGLGSLLSSLLLLGQPAEARLRQLILLSTVGCALAMPLFALSSWLPLSLLAMLVLGFGITCSNVSSNILLQGMAPEALRGRLISLYTSSRFGFDALGGLLAGVLAHLLGPAPVLVAGGSLLLVFCLVGGRACHRAA